jgi:anti-anti-sigma factor
MTIADLQTSSQDGVVTARLSGEIDMSNAGDLMAAITKASPNDALGVALDLGDVDYLDSSGIHLLYRLRESLNSRGQALSLVIPEGSLVTDALRLAGISDHMDSVATLDEARQAIRAAGV